MSGGSTLYTRPQTGASIVSVVQNKESSHFVSQMSSTEALGLINNNNHHNNHNNRDNINIEDAIRAISRADQHKTSQSPTAEMLEDSEFKPRIFSKFWSVGGGANSDNKKSDKVWKTQREQRAESEIIAKQRKRDDVEDESLIQKLRRRQKISY